MLEAHARGLINYAEFDSRDPTHVIRENAILRYVMDSISGELIKLQHDRELVMLAMAPHLKNPDSVKNKLVTSVFNVFKQYGATRAPWLDWDEDSQNTIDSRELDRLKERWEAYFGSLDDPEVQERLKNYTQKSKQEIPKNAKVIKQY